MKHIIIILLVFNSITALSRDIHVGNNHVYKTIKSGINAASDGDIVYLHKGNYYENDILINKKISIKGIDNPVIDAGFKGGNLLQVTSDNVIISGIILKNIPNAYISDNSAIKIINSSYCSLENIKIENGFFGIYLSNSSNILVKNNMVTGVLRTETSSGNGIHLWKCRDISIINNTIKNHRDGIYFEFVKNSYIEGNNCRNNLRYGLHYMYSDSCSYINNEFIDNGAGVAVMFTKNILMKKNIFSHNWGPASYGLLLKEIANSSITENVFKNNTTGIHAEGTSKILIKNNSFSGNGWALKMMGNCIDNTITLNDFISNTFDVSTNSMNSFNYFYKNYWSKYQGYDLNKDKKGDIPYYPVSLFSKTIETAEESIILMNSFFIEILETAEKYIPSVIPKKVRDDQPLMESINAGI